MGIEGDGEEEAFELGGGDRVVLAAERDIMMETAVALGRDAHAQLLDRWGWRPSLIIATDT